MKFYERLTAYRAALTEDVIISRDPALDKVKNETARMFRNGLAIISFVILEDFIRSRTVEIIQKVGGGTLAFAKLPNGLREAVTFGILESIQFQLKTLKNLASTREVYIQAHAEKVASTMRFPFELSELAFGFSKSNITESDVEKILTSFNIDNPWNSLGGIANSCGLGGSLNMKQIYETALLRRHESAHDITKIVEISELESFLLDSIGFAISFDLLLSTALFKILKSDSDYVSGKKLNHKSVKIRSIEKDSRREMWKEFTLGQKRASRTNTNRDTLITDCLVKSSKDFHCMVVKDVKGFPDVWHTPFIH